MLMRTGGFMLIAGMLFLGGCLEREITVTSEPPGALVLLNGVEVGRTPLTTPFLWYGDYDVRLRLQDHHTLTTNADINPPLYAIPPIDLVMELLPWTIRDSRYLHYELEKVYWPEDPDAQRQAEDELIQRAQDMRQRNLQPVE